MVSSDAYPSLNRWGRNQRGMNENRLCETLICSDISVEGYVHFNALVRMCVSEPGRLFALDLPDVDRSGTEYNRENLRKERQPL